MARYRYTTPQATPSATVWPFTVLPFVIGGIWVVIGFVYLLALAPFWIPILFLLAGLLLVIVGYSLTKGARV